MKYPKGKFFSLFANNHPIKLTSNTFTLLINLKIINIEFINIADFIKNFWSFTLLITLPFS